MTFALEAGQTVNGVAGTAAAVTYTLSGLQKTPTGHTYLRLAQGQLPAVAAAIYTVPPDTEAISKTLFLRNTSASQVDDIVLYIGGTAPDNEILGLSLPAFGSAVITDDGWTVKDAVGNTLQTSAFALTGDVTAAGVGTAAATVVGLQGRPVAATLPTTGQALEWDGAAWAPATTVNTVTPADASVTIGGTALDPTFATGRADQIFTLHPPTAPVDFNTQEATNAAPPTTGTSLATKAYVDNLVIGLSDFRGDYDASTNLFPAAGGSGAAGAVLKGDTWIVSVGGTLGGVAVTIGDWIFAKGDTPGQTAGNWSLIEHNFTYVPEDVANKSTDGTFAANSTTLYPSQSAVVTYVAARIAALAPNVTLTAFGATPNAQGASLATQALTLQPADGSSPGGISLGAQTLGTGTKTLGGLVVTGASFQVDSSGRLGIVNGINSAALITLANGANHPGTATSLYGIISQPTFPATTTVAGTGTFSQVRTAAAAFTLATGTVYVAGTPTVGAGSAITTAVGFNAKNQGVAGVTNAYGILVEAQSGAATLNIGASLAGGTQANLWLNSDTASAAGGIAFGLARDQSFYRFDATRLEASGTVSAVTGFQVNHALAVAGTVLRGDGTRFIAGQVIPGDIPGFDTQVRTSRLDQMATPTADVSLGGFKITNLVDGVSLTDAATVGQLSALTNGQVWKHPVDASTTAVLPAVTYANGAAGVGATLTEVGNGALPAQDGVTLIAGDTLLVKNQAAGLQNGIYTVTQVGTGGTPFILTRRTDADTNTELTDGTVLVQEGTDGKGDIYTFPTITTMGTTDATPSKTGEGNTVYTADGTTITLTGQIFSRSAITGDVSIPAGSAIATLANVGPGATGPFGSTSTTPVITINAKGLVTALTSATITPAAIGAVPTTRTITATAPLTIGGGASADLSADRTIAISAATTAAAGTMSALDKQKLDNLWIDVTANTIALVLPGNTAAQNVTNINAILAAAPTGSTIHFPVGVYNFNAAWTVPNKVFQFHGVGWTRSGAEAELCWTSNVAGTLITLPNLFWYTSFENLTFTTTVDQTAGYVVQCGNNVGINFTNCAWATAGGFFNSCIGYDTATNGGNSSKVDTCILSGYKGTGIRLSTSGSSLIISNTIIQGQWGGTGGTPAAAMAAAGISGGFVGALQINDCDILGNVNNLLSNPVLASSEVSASIFCTNTYFDNSGGSCIKISGTGATVRARFDTCSFTTAGTNFTTPGTNLSAVEIASTFAYAAGGQGIDFVNCNVLNTFATTGTSNGFLISGTADHSVSNCRVAGWTNGINTTPIATAGRTQCQYSNNTIGPAGGYSGNTVGILLNAGGAAYGPIVLDGNILIGNGTPLTDNATSSYKVYGTQPGLPNGSVASSAIGATVTTTAEIVLAVLPLPANSAKVGTTYKFAAAFKSAVTTVHNLRVRIGTSATVPATNTSVVLLADLTSANNVVVEGIGAINAIGGAATHIGNATFGNVAVATTTAVAAATSSFNTAVDNFVMLTLANVTSTTTTVYGATLDVVNP